uniref:Casein kinase I isoform X2 n=1 Tax=Rhizophora mucronata TaxID=61149 RepID=A0A2P2ISB8_RHIMU
MKLNDQRSLSEPKPEKRPQKSNRTESKMYKAKKKFIEKFKQYPLIRKEKQK